MEKAHIEPKETEIHIIVATDKSSRVELSKQEKNKILYSFIYLILIKVELGRIISLE